MNHLEKIPTGPQPPMPNELQPPTTAEVWPPKARWVGDLVAKIGANNPKPGPMPTIGNDLPTEEKMVPFKGVQGYRDGLAAGTAQDAAASIKIQRGRHFRRGAALLGKTAAGVAAASALVGAVIDSKSSDSGTSPQNTSPSVEQVQDGGKLSESKPTTLPGPTEIPDYKTGRSNENTTTITLPPPR